MTLDYQGNESGQAVDRGERLYVSPRIALQHVVTTIKGAEVVFEKR